MVRRSVLTFMTALLVGVLPLPAAAQDRPRCHHPEGRAFDFWIGAWTIDQEILQSDGSWRRFSASNEVTAALDGCALVERWRGDALFSGRA